MLIYSFTTESITQYNLLIWSESKHAHYSTYYMNLFVVTMLVLRLYLGNIKIKLLIYDFINVDAIDTKYCTLGYANR